MEDTHKKEMDRDLIHDVKNGLAVIRMDAEVALLSSLSPEEHKEVLARIIAEIDHVNTLFKKP